MVLNSCWSVSEGFRGKAPLPACSRGQAHRMKGTIEVRVTWWLELSWEEVLRASCFSGKEGFGRLLFVKRRMGAIDMFYRFLCCFSLGDVAKNGQNDSTNSESKTIGYQGHRLGPTSPSSSQSCWCGFLSRERKSKIPFSSENGKLGQQKHYIYHGKFLELYKDDVDIVKRCKMLL